MPNTLTITIVGAKGLRNVDGITLAESESYCTCEIPGEPGSRFSTGAVTGSVEPEWNYTSEITGIEPSDSLEFAVCTKGVAGEEGLLGKVLLTGANFYRHGFEGELPLSGGIAMGTIAVKVVMDDEPPASLPAWTSLVPMPDIVSRPWLAPPTDFDLGRHSEPPPPPADQARVLPEAPPQMTRVDIQGLRDCTLPDGLRGPVGLYCHVEVMCKSGAAFATNCSRSGLQAVWNETFEIANVESGRGLEFAVLSKEATGGRDKILGRTRLGKDVFHPYGWEGNLRLTGSLQGALEVRISAVYSGALPSIPPQDTYNVAPNQPVSRPEHVEMNASGLSNTVNSSVAQREPDYWSGLPSRGTREPPSPPGWSRPQIAATEEPFRSPLPVQLQTQVPAQADNPRAPARKGVNDSCTLLAAGPVVTERKISSSEAKASGNLVEDAANADLKVDKSLPEVQLAPRRMLVVPPMDRAGARLLASQTTETQLGTTPPRSGGISLIGGGACYFGTHATDPQLGTTPPRPAASGMTWPMHAQSRQGGGFPGGTTGPTPRIFGSTSLLPVRTAPPVGSPGAPSVTFSTPGYPLPASAPQPTTPHGNAQGTANVRGTVSSPVRRSAMSPLAPAASPLAPPSASAFATAIPTATPFNTAQAAAASLLVPPNSGQQLAMAPVATLARLDWSPPVPARPIAAAQASPVVRTLSPTRHQHEATLAAAAASPPHALTYTRGCSPTRGYERLTQQLSGAGLTNPAGCSAIAAACPTPTAPPSRGYPGAQSPGPPSLPGVAAGLGLAGSASPGPPAHWLMGMSNSPATPQHAGLVRL